MPARSSPTSENISQRSCSCRCADRTMQSNVASRRAWRTGWHGCVVFSLPRTRSPSFPCPLLSIRPAVLAHRRGKRRGEGGRRPGEEWFGSSMRDSVGEFSPREGRVGRKHVFVQDSPLLSLHSFLAARGRIDFREVLNYKLPKRSSMRLCASSKPSSRFSINVL